MGFKPVTLRSAIDISGLVFLHSWCPCIVAEQWDICTGEEVAFFMLWFDPNLPVLRIHLNNTGPTARITACLYGARPPNTTCLVKIFPISSRDSWQYPAVWFYNGQAVGQNENFVVSFVILEDTVSVEYQANDDSSILANADACGKIEELLDEVDDSQTQAEVEVERQDPSHSAVGPRFENLRDEIIEEESETQSWIEEEEEANQTGTCFTKLLLAFLT